MEVMEEIKGETCEPPPDETSAVDEELERAELQKYIDELNAKIKFKLELREKNIKRQLPQDDHFVKLDSSLKKNTAFVKKLKQFTAAQLDSLLKDMSTLNLTKYISEVAQSLTEAKIKMTDVAAVITFSSQL